MPQMSVAVALLSMQAVRDVMKWHDARAAALLGAGSRVKTPPLCVVHCLSTLVAGVGVEGVLVAQRDACRDTLHPTLQRLLQGLPAWKQRFVPDS